MKKKWAFGIDIGGTTVKIGFFSAKGRLEKKFEIRTRKNHGGSLILPDIARAVGNVLWEKKISKEDICGIGLGVPGPVLQERMVNRCVNLGWGHMDVAGELKKLTGISDIKVENDANVAALGELWKGGGKGFQNMVMVTLGTGVGGGVIMDGKIVPGAFGAGGEIGHMKIRHDEIRVCGCGQTGHLEQYASAKGMGYRAKEILENSDRPTILRDQPYISAKIIFDCAKAGDEVALEVVDFVGEMLGKALSYVSCVIDPEVYVIGGGVSKAGEILLSAIQKHFQEYVFHASSGVKFSLAQMGNNAGIYGAVKMVLE